MDALPSIVTVPRHQQHRILAGVVAASLAVGAGFVAGRATAPRAVGPVGHPYQTAAPDAEAWNVPKITGTGPDLLEMAARARAVRSAPLTGTGPGLVLVAAYGQDEAR